MMPLLSATYNNVYVDHQLFGLEVSVFTPPPADSPPALRIASVVSYLQGVAAVNNLEFISRGQNIFLRGADLPSGSLISLGFLTEEFKEVSANLAWDVFPIAGKTFVEVPHAHKPYLDTLQNVQRLPYQLEFTVVFYEKADILSQGVTLRGFIDLNLKQFDAIHGSDFNLLSENMADFNLSWSPNQIETIFEDNITTTLTGIMGSKTSISMSDEIPYSLTDLNRDGLSVRRQVQFIEAGFLVDIDSAFAGALPIFDFQIENSAPDFSRSVEGLPLIRRRKVANRLPLQKGSVVEVCRIATKVSNTSKRGLPFIKKIRGKDSQVTEGLVSIFVKRVL